MDYLSGITYLPTFTKKNVVAGISFDGKVKWQIIFAHQRRWSNVHWDLESKI